ncbi:hypothetical protein BH09VER1_BH09VER1_13350 [soil metagenome]
MLENGVISRPIPHLTKLYFKIDSTLYYNPMIRLLGSPNRICGLSLLAASLTTFLAAGNGHAAVIAEQEYNTTTPSATFGFNGGSVTPPPYNFLDVGTSQTGLTYNTLTTTGESRLISSNPQGGFSGGPQSNNGIYFISFLLNNNGSTNAREGLTLFANFFNDGNGNGTGTEVAELGQNGGFINILTGNYGSGTAFQSITSAIATSAATHLYVIGIDTNSTANTTTLSLYYDPVTQTGNTSVLTYSVGLPAFHLNNIRAYGGGIWDEFRVGDTFADVTPGLASVPEPTTMLLSSLGFAVVLWRKRAEAE